MTQGMPPADMALSWLGAGPARPPLVAGTAVAGAGTEVLPEPVVPVPNVAGMVKLVPMMTWRAPPGTDALCWVASPPRVARAGARVSSAPAYYSK